MRNIRIAEKKLNKVATFIGDNPVRLSTICYHLNKEFKSLSVKFRSKLHNHYSISGHFNPYRFRDEGDMRYNVLITYEEKQKIVADKQFWEELMLILVHEFRHGYQNRKCPQNIGLKYSAKFNHLSKFVRAEVSYLTEPNELDAYAYETAYAIDKNMANWHNHWTIERYRVFVDTYAPKLYKKFLKKVYLFSHK